MRYRIYILLLVVLTVAVIAAAVGGAGTGWIAGLCAAMLIVTALLMRSVHIPLKAVQNGIYLLREQDFSSRLRLTGQPDADNIVGLYNNLIDSMRAERLKSLEQERFLSLVVEASPMAVAICDYDGNIVQTNRAWDTMQSPQLSEAIAAVADGATATVRVAESLIVRISRLWFMDKGFRRRFILVEKLTDEIAAAQKQMFNTIVRTIGHEVNNSLGSVMSVLESLAEMHADDPTTSGAITGCTDACNNLVNFVRGYADIVKLPAPVAEPTDLNEWLRRLMPTLQALTAGSETAIKVELPEEHVRSSIDPMLMERVLINIVKNAAESIAARKGSEPMAAGLIKIALTADNSNGKASDGYRLTVTDNGRGISPEAAGNLFTPFFSTKHPDRGLGLMLVADILRAHRSDFTLATDPSNGLTTFSFTLPRGASPL